MPVDSYTENAWLTVLGIAVSFGGLLYMLRCRPRVFPYVTFVKVKAMKPLPTNTVMVPNISEMADQLLQSRQEVAELITAAKV